MLHTNSFTSLWDDNDRSIDENVFRDEIEVVHTSDELVDGVTSVPVASGGRVQPRGT